MSHIRPKLQESEDMIRSFYMLRSYNRDSDSECDIIEIRYSAAGEDLVSCLLDFLAFGRKFDVYFSEIYLL